MPASGAMVAHAQRQGLRVLHQCEAEQLMSLRRHGISQRALRLTDAHVDAHVNELAT